MPPRELPNELRLDLSKFGNIRKISNLSGDETPFKRSNIGNTSQKSRMKRYQTFFIPSSFTRFFYFVRDWSFLKFVIIKKNSNIYIYVTAKKAPLTNCLKYLYFQILWIVKQYSDLIDRLKRSAVCIALIL